MATYIMIVDDDKGLLTLVNLMLRRGGFSVLEAESSATALELLKETVPDLFILDVMMPDIDGIELCLKLRAAPQTAEKPVIMLSAFGDAKFVDQAMDAGANAYLTKPITRQDLLEEVGQLLSGSDSEIHH